MGGGGRDNTRIRREKPHYITGEEGYTGRTGKNNRIFEEKTE